jgi:hypothetical protein
MDFKRGLLDPSHYRGAPGERLGKGRRGRRRGRARARGLDRRRGAFSQDGRRGRRVMRYDPRGLSNGTASGGQFADHAPGGPEPILTPTIALLSGKRPCPASPRLAHTRGPREPCARPRAVDVPAIAPATDRGERSALPPRAAEDPEVVRGALPRREPRQQVLGGADSARIGSLHPRSCPPGGSRGQARGPPLFLGAIEMPSRPPACQSCRGPQPEPEEPETNQRRIQSHRREDVGELDVRN